MAVQMAPSILNADFARLADEAAAVADVADWLHVDRTSPSGCPSSSRCSSTPSCHWTAT
jgi:ribulose phosphate 3-epimerase family protein